ncbi:2324_t:CDS:2 [Funneliformis geosporum]|nr:2324_t:CDS:2 [Funneliformis geosporum]
MAHQINIVKLITLGIAFSLIVTYVYAETKIVKVGGNGLLKFVPQNITAVKGDVIRWEFEGGMHNVVQSDGLGSCELSQMENTFKSTTNPVNGFELQITDTKATLYYLCSVGTHCMNGMWGVIYVGGTEPTPIVDAATPTSAPSSSAVRFVDSDEYNVIIKVGQGESLKTFNAHSVILKAQSPYFLSSLKNCEKRDDKFLFEKPNVSPKVFDVILKYIYSGSISLVNFNSGELMDVLVTANEFILNELVSHIENILLASTNEWPKYCDKTIQEKPSTLLESGDSALLDESVLKMLLEKKIFKFKEIEIQRPGLKKIL